MYSFIKLPIIIIVLILLLSPLIINKNVMMMVKKNSGIIYLEVVDIYCYDKVFCDMKMIRKVDV